VATYADSVAGGSTSGSGDRTATITPAVGDLIVVFAGFRGITGTPTADATDDQGGTYTLVESAFWGASGSEAFFLVRDTLVSSAVAHLVTVSGVSSTSGNVVPVTIAGMTKTGATAVLQSKALENQSGTTPSVVFDAACDTANLTLGAVFDNLNPPGQTAPTGWTEREDAGQVTPNNGIQVVTRDSGFTGTTVTWGAAESGVYGAMIVELDTSGAGGSVYALDIGHVASVEAAHGVDLAAQTLTLDVGHAATAEAAYGLDLTVPTTVPAPLVRPEYTGTPRFVLDATGETILLRGANTILSASDAVSEAAVDAGANAMRLVLNWHDLEPVAPTGSGTDFTTYVTSLDATTLAEIDTLCTYFAAAGAYVALDFHQAAWSP
jgi:hypothetical protein